MTRPALLLVPMSPNGLHDVILRFNYAGIGVSLDDGVYLENGLMI